MLTRQGMPMLAAAALVLPAIIALAVWLTAQQDEQRRDVERDAIETTQKVLTLTEAEVALDRRVVQVMAGSPTLIAGDYPTFRERIARIVEEDPDWNGLIVRERTSGRVLLEVSESGGSDRGVLQVPERSRLPSLSGIQREGRYCPCVILSAPVGNGDREMVLFLDPAPFQTILRENVPSDSISAIVDREGRFIARTRQFDARVGTPGSTYLRKAVQAGGEGLYRGVTLEGFESYTAYSTSPQLGWSVHIALDVSEIEGPQAWANASVAIGILAALALAAGLSFYAAYETRRRRLDQQRLLGMQKAEAISRFTGTMAHDFRNILSVIDAGVRLIQRHTAEELTTKRAQAIGDAVQRGNRLVNQLLSFVRGDGAEVRALDLRACLQGADELIERSLGDGIAFRWSVDEDARFARANADQFELALLNLAINARDAMTGMGEFTITAHRDGAFVAVSACDNGPGVPPPLRERIFETFYSTKVEGGGTGLGLAQVGGAARQAGGRVELKDSPSGGACFVMYLPAAEAADE